MLNGTSWWNTGAATMLWSGGNADAPGAALHEGGHGFHQLADEYGDLHGRELRHEHERLGPTGQVYAEVNSCGNPATTGGKWDRWIGYNQTRRDRHAEDLSGSRYVGGEPVPAVGRTR